MTVESIVDRMDGWTALCIKRDDIVLLDTRETGWADLPYDLALCEVERISAGENLLVLYIEDRGEDDE